MGRLDPTAATTKWAQRMGAAAPQITEGVQAVTVAPGVTAAKQQAKWLARIQASAQKWATNVAAVSLGDWQQAMIQRGIPNITTGVAAKQGNYQNFATKFFQYLANGKSQIDAMPTGTVAQGIAKAAAQIEYNSKYTGGNGRS